VEPIACQPIRGETGRTPRDYGRGRVCVEPGCRTVVSRYSFPAPDGARCHLHFRVPPEVSVKYNDAGDITYLPESGYELAPETVEAMRYARAMNRADVQRRHNLGARRRRELEEEREVDWFPVGTAADVEAAA
jgi:hypothetical protein